MAPTQNTDASAVEILSETHSAIHTLFSAFEPVNPDRLVYALCGLLFSHTNPAPFGGSKRHPGFTEFEGGSVEELVAWMIIGAYRLYWSRRGREAVECFVENVNRVLEECERGGSRKGCVDEWVLAGMRKCGHLGGGFEGVLPEGLRDVRGREGAGEEEEGVVLFTPPRQGLSLAG
ncbi:hypothetical protein HDU79_004332 [Rhizoclosmatium sp. JEL0117]|nr:hypothetical protein HDU79_004332 [Rhizoclosmatium sp. JEL0117]